MGFRGLIVEESRKHHVTCPLFWASLAALLIQCFQWISNSVRCALMLPRSMSGARVWNIHTNSKTQHSCAFWEEKSNLGLVFDAVLNLKKQQQQQYWLLQVCENCACDTAGDAYLSSISEWYLFLLFIWLSGENWSEATYKIALWCFTLQ